MNIQRLIPYCLLAGLLAFSACENEQMTDMEKQGTELPEGKYPLTFTAVQAAPEGMPQTRVSENDNASSWTNGDEIKVKVTAANAKVQESTCTLYADGNIKNYTPQLYWQTTGNHTFNAWYSNISGQATASKTVSLANQTGGLAYVLKADAKTASYQTSATDMKLLFKHQLAKVRVKLKGDKANDVTKVEVKAYASCNVTDGNVTSSGNIQYIQIHKQDASSEYYEANLVPMKSITSNDFIKLNGNTQATINNITELKVGNMYTIEIDVKPAGPKPITPGETITEPGDYIMTGNITQGVTLNGNSINLTLERVTANIGNAIKVTGGSPTIIVKGISNSFNGDGAGILISPNASVTIEGATSNANDSKLTIKAGSSNQPGIGSPDGNTCENIIIKNVTLDVTGGDGYVGGAAIGTSGNWGSGCGNIEITNSIIKATSGRGAAAIGMGYNCDCGYSIGAITITNSQLTINTNPFGTIIGAGIGLGGNPNHSASTGYQVCGKITIITKESKETFFSRFNTGEGFKAGKTNSSQYWPYQQWNGIVFNGETLADGNSNGYK